MNGVHDMGGMHGFGPIRPEADEPVFHETWEGRIYAMHIAMGAWGRWTVDANRHSREVIPPAEYLRMSYYQRWVVSLETLLVQAALVSTAELASGRPDSGSRSANPPLAAASVPQMLAAGAPSARPSTAPPRFAVGERVRAQTLNPVSHTRLPRYVRGRVGTIVRDHGFHVFPDTSALGLGEQPQRLYGVRFGATELWGPFANPSDAVSLDLWDAYLESL
jgi:nitrile hydratase beta subunit